MAPPISPPAFSGGPSPRKAPAVVAAAADVMCQKCSSQAYHLAAVAHDSHCSHTNCEPTTMQRDADSAGRPTCLVLRGLFASEAANNAPTPPPPQPLQSLGKQSDAQLTVSAAPSRCKCHSSATAAAPLETIGNARKQARRGQSAAQPQSKVIDCMCLRAA